MNKDLQKSGVPLSAEFGWSQMSLLLDEQLPIKRVTSKRGKRALSRGFLLVSLMISLSLSLNVANNSSTRLPANRNIALPIHGDITAKGQSGMQGEISVPQQFSLRTPLSNSGDPSSPAAPGDLLATPGDTSLTRVPFLAPTTQAYQFLRTARNITSIPFFVPARQENKLPLKTNPWEFSVGLSQNINMRSSQQFLPAPFAAFTYRLSPGFSVTAGVQPFSRIANDASGVSKTGFINDTLSNIRHYNELTGYGKLVYTDVPVYAGMELSKHLSILVGVQGSFLVSKSKTQKTVFYDYQMNPVRVNGIAPINTAAAPSQEEFDVSPRKMDLRLLAGIRYSLGKTALSVEYQHGVQPLLKGAQVSASGNSLLAVKLQVKIR